MNLWKNASVSTKTTVMGVLGFVVALLTAIMAQIDGDPSTTANWSAVMALLFTMLGLSQARDADKKSEDHK